MQAHDLHHHLVGVGGAVEGARAGPVIGGRFGLEQLGAADLALGEQLPDLGLLVVGQARGHRPGGDEHGGEMAEGQGADHEARHDLVADAEVDGGIEGLVGERDRGRQRDDLAAEQRQLHAGLALGDAVAHGGHAARDLGGAPRLARRLPDHLGVGLVGLMRREHVVVSGDDGKVGAVAAAQHGLVAGMAGGEAMRLVRATERLPSRTRRGRRLNPLEVARAARAAPLGDAGRDLADPRVKGGRALPGVHDGPRLSGAPPSSQAGAATQS